MAQRLTGIRVQSYVGGTVVCEDNPTSCCSGLSPISGGGIIINSGTSVLYNNVTITINSGIIYLNGSNVYVQSGSIITYQSGVKIDNKNNIITSISVTDNRSGGSIITYYGVDTFNFVGGGQVVVNSGSYTYQGGSVNNTSGLRTTNTNTITTTQGGSISLVSATTVTNNLTVTTVQGGSVTYQSGPTITYQDATITAGGLTTATYNGTAITYNSGSNETFTLVSRTVNSGNELFKGVAIALRSGTREDVYDATFSFNSGSRLNVPAGAIALSSGGTMSVSDAGSITINSGASLVLASGASLTLNGQSTGGSSTFALARGQVCLDSSVDISGGTTAWKTISGLQVTLPGSGVFCLQAEVNAGLTVGNLGNAYIAARLWDHAISGEISGTIRKVVGCNLSGSNCEGTAPIVWNYAVTSGVTILVQAVPVFTAPPSQMIIRGGTGNDGNSRLGYFSLGN